MLDLHLPRALSQAEIPGALESKLKCLACKPHGVGSRSSLKGPGGVQGALSWEAVGFYDIKQNHCLSLFNIMKMLPPPFFKALLW